MPYKRTAYTRRRPSRLGRGRRGRFMPRSTAARATRALRLARTVRSLVRPEFKWVDSVITPQTIPNTAAGAALLGFNGIAQGTTVNTRLGNKITMRSCLFRCEITGGESCRIRMMLVVDRRRHYNVAAGSMPALSDDDILANLTYPIISPLSKTQSSRWTILRDQIINYDHDDGGKKTLNWFFKLRHTVEYPTNTWNEPTVGGIYLLAITDASSVPSMAGIVRLNFMDN